MDPLHNSDNQPTPPPTPTIPINPINNDNQAPNNNENRTVGATRWCKHKGPCMHNAVRGLLRGFLLGYGLRAALALVATVVLGNKKIKSPTVLLKNIFNAVVSSTPLNFGLFLSGYIGGFKGTQCALRRLRQTDDGINSSIAGAVAGASFYILRERNPTPESYSELVPYALYLMLRALEACWRRLETAGYVKSIPNFNAVLFGIGTGSMFWAYSVEPESLRPSYRRVCILFCCLPIPHHHTTYYITQIQHHISPHSHNHILLP